jgi:hypothetical protein
MKIDLKVLKKMNVKRMNQMIYLFKNEMTLRGKIILVVYIGIIFLTHIIYANTCTKI